MTVKERIREMAIILLWGLACWLFFQFFYSYHFFYQEQNQLFLFSGDYLATYFQKPAWAACMAGDFLTQFYYYRFAGPVILTITLLVMGDLLCRSFRQIHNGTWAFGASIVLMTLEAYFFLHHDHRLSSAMAIIIGSLLFLFYAIASRRMHPVVRVVFGMSLGIVAYSTAGYGWIVFALFAIVYDIVKKKRLKWWGCFLILGMIVIAITTTNRSYLLNTTANLTYPGIAHYAKPDFELEKTLAVDNEYYFGNWGKVEQLVEGEEHPNEVQLFFYNLVKAQKGELPDYLLKFSPNQLGTFYTIGPSTPKLIINNMNELYWALGDMTLTERAAMMTNVFAPDNRNIRMMKRLADCNLVSGDTLAANKYLNILQQTWVYSKWARLIKAHDPKTWRYFIEKKQFVNHADTIRLNDNLHMVMMELLDSNPHNTVALDYILCSTLLLKDIDNFKRDYDRYCIATGKPRQKPLYQQALMIWLAGTNAPEEDWQKYILDQEQLRRFQEYNNHRGDSRFAGTYWYYFDTAQVPKI